MTQRVLFFGMEGEFSRAPLLRLIQSEHTVCAIIVPRPEQSQPADEPLRLIPPPRAPEADVPLLFQPRELNVIGMGWNAGIDVYEVADLRADATVRAIERLHPDLIVVACFNLLLPPSIVSKIHSLNLHPSLLPQYRGSAPLFWLFHDGLERAGVTVHLMEASPDTGDIVAQARVELPDGIRYGEAEKKLSEHAARLLPHALDNAPDGRFIGSPQPRQAAPRAPTPTTRDYIVTSDWSARRAFNFVRGIGQAEIRVNEQVVVTQDAIEYQVGERIPRAIVRVGSALKIQFTDGTVTVQPKSEPNSQSPHHPITRPS